MKHLIIIFTFLLAANFSFAQKVVINYDESKVPVFTPPDPLIFTNGQKTYEALLLLVLPNWNKEKVPVFVSYNYRGNHSTCFEPDVEYSPLFSVLTPSNNPDWVRGCQASRWCYDKILDRGYGIATMFYQDIYPDTPGKEELGIVSLFPDFKPGRKAPDEWQAIGAWAWGSSRIADYLETQKRVDRSAQSIYCQRSRRPMG